MKIEQKIDELYVEHLSKYNEEPTIILMNKFTLEKISKNFKYVFGINSKHKISKLFFYRGIKIYETPDLDNNEVLVK
jgi:hypothetical protein